MRRIHDKIDVVNILENIVFKIGPFYVTKGYQCAFDNFGLSFGWKPGSGHAISFSLKQRRLVIT